MDVSFKDFIDLGQRVGLPALVCYWLMFRIEKRHDTTNIVLMGMAKDISAILAYESQGDKKT